MATAESASPERKLMPGENPTSEYLADADHWISVYEELLTFDRDLLGTLRSQLDGDANGSALKADLEKLESRLDQLTDGLSYWRRRRSALTTNGHI